jgi:hypothetical protein
MSKGVVGAFANDPRILAWDLWNEPDNGNDRFLRQRRASGTRTRSSSVCLPQVFAWARTAHPTQPLTSGLLSRRLEFSGRRAAPGARAD